MVAGSGVKSGRRSETEAAVTGIIGAKNESIDIPTELFQNQNSTGMYTYILHTMFSHVHMFMNN